MASIPYSKFEYQKYDINTLLKFRVPKVWHQILYSKFWVLKVWLFKTTYYWATLLNRPLKECIGTKTQVLVKYCSGLINTWTFSAVCMPASAISIAASPTPSPKMLWFSSFHSSCSLPSSEIKENVVRPNLHRNLVSSSIWPVRSLQRSTNSSSLVQKYIPGIA